MTLNDELNKPPLLSSSFKGTREWLKLSTPKKEHQYLLKNFLLERHMAAVFFLFRLFCQMCLVLERRVQLHFMTLTVKTPQTLNKQYQAKKVLYPAAHHHSGADDSPTTYQWKGRLPNLVRESLPSYVLREIIWVNLGFSGIKMGVLTHSLCCQSISKYSTVSDISSETVRSRGWHHFLTIFESFSEADLGKLRVNHPTPQLPQGG